MVVITRLSAMCLELRGFEFMADKMTKEWPSAPSECLISIEMLCVSVEVLCSPANHVASLHSLFLFQNVLPLWQRCMNS